MSNRGDIGRMGPIERFSTKKDGSKHVSFDVVKRMAQIKKMKKKA